MPVCIAVKHFQLFIVCVDVRRVNGYLGQNLSILMIREFNFSWQGRRWNGYFNAIPHQAVIAHFEDDQIRDAIGQTLTYSKTEKGAIACSATTDVLQSHADMYEAIQKGVEGKLGKSLQHFLN
jgi:hypothetical protein